MVAEELHVTTKGSVYAASQKDLVMVVAKPSVHPTFVSGWRMNGVLPPRRDEKYARTSKHHLQRHKAHDE